MGITPDDTIRVIAYTGIPFHRSWSVASYRVDCVDVQLISIPLEYLVLTNGRYCAGYVFPSYSLAISSSAAFQRASAGESDLVAFDSFGGLNSEVRTQNA